jgi:hypothetical protein
LEFEKLLLRGCNTGEFTIENVTIVANNIISAAHMWTLRNWLLAGAYSLDEYIQIQTDIILSSIVTRRERDYWQLE